MVWFHTGSFGDLASKLYQLHRPHVESTGYEYD